MWQDFASCGLNIRDWLRSLFMDQRDLNRPDRRRPSVFPIAFNEQRGKRFNDLRETCMMLYQPHMFSRDQM